MVKRLSNLFTTFWPFGLFSFYVLIILSFTEIEPALMAQIFGLSVVAAAAVAWLVIDYVSVSDNRVRTKLKEMESLLKPYEGMKLKEMPPEVQEEVRRRLGWTTPPAKEAAKSQK